MNSRLKEYINSLFENAPSNERAQEYKEEILFNSEEKYNDLIKSGKTEDEAYKAVVAGIGDLGELFAALRGDASKAAATAGSAPKADAVSTDAPKADTGSTDAPGACNANASAAAAPPIIATEAQNQTEKKKRRRLPAVAIVFIVIGAVLTLLFTVFLCLRANRVITLTDQLAELGNEIGKEAHEFAEDLSEDAAELAEDITEHAKTPSGSDKKRSNVDASYDDQSFGGVREISINWASGSVSMLPSDTGKLYFSELGQFDPEDEALQYKVINSEKLEINFAPDSLSALLKASIKKDLYVYVPTDTAVYFSVDINSAAASVNISDLSLGELDVKSASGDTMLTRVSAEDADIYSASGELTMDGTEARSIDAGSVSGRISYTGSFTEGDFETTSGTIDIVSQRTPAELDIESVSGSVTVTLPEDSSFSLETESVSGDLDSEFALKTGGKKHTCGKTPEKCSISIETVSGDMNMKQS